MGQARKSLWIETVKRIGESFGTKGQARKSLWIETIQGCIDYAATNGQARKSLWIETTGPNMCVGNYLVRLVRACGSKQLQSLQLPGH